MKRENFKNFGGCEREMLKYVPKSEEGNRYILEKRIIQNKKITP